MKIKEFFINRKNETADSVMNFKQHPLSSIEQLIPVIIVLISSIAFVVSLIEFTINSGYTSQIEIIKSGLGDGFMDSFTIGTVKSLWNGIASHIILSLLAVEFIVLFISYISSENKGKKISFITLSISGIIITVLSGLFWLVCLEKINFSEELKNKIYEKLNTIGTQKIMHMLTTAEITFIIGIILVLIAVALVIISKHAWVLGHSAVALVISYVVFPLLLWIIENAIPLLIAIALIIGVVLVGKIIAKSDSNSSTNTSFSKNKSSNSKNKTEPKKEKYQKPKKIDLNTTFWRDKGGYGIDTPTADCIYYKDNMGVKRFACTVKEFESGDVAIYNKGKRITTIAGCQPPKR